MVCVRQQIATHNALATHGTILFSLEMSEHELADRHLAAHARTPHGKIRAANLTDRLRLVIVDYLQLIAAHPGDRFANRYELVSEISRSLNMLARELQIPVLAIAQLSRESERRPDKRPQSQTSATPAPSNKTPTPSNCCTAPTATTSTPSPDSPK